MTEIIYDIRQTGRTTKLVDMVKDGRIKDTNKRILIVLTKGIKKRIIEKFDLKEYEVMSYDELITQFHSRDKIIYLDDIDIYMMRITGMNIGCINIEK